MTPRWSSHERPTGVAGALESRLRSDYLGWITSAKLPATQQKRLRQMLDELAAGSVYMGMAHAPSRKPTPRR